MPELTWIGKNKVVTHHLDVPYRVLENQYTYGKNADGTDVSSSENMVIHGDNLEALKSLLPMYEGRVDCIYIDPPYNTGNESWVYNDNVKDPQILKWLGEVVGKEGEDLSRHDKWLCMMYPRLRLLQRLLAPTGAIFISIDDNEVAHLRLICNEIFGARCFVADISWQRTYSPRNDSKGIPAEVEHLLVFSKEPGWQPRKLERTAETDTNYKNPDNDYCPWTSSDAFAPGAATHQGMVYAVQHPFTGELIYPTAGRCWSLGQEDILSSFSGWTEYELRDIDDAEKRAELCGIPADEVRAGVRALMLVKPLEEAQADAQAVYERGPWPRFYITSGGKGGVRRKTYLDSVGGILPSNFWDHQAAGHTDAAKKEIRAIFDGRVAFDTPKPVRLVERVLAIATDSDSIVLDSFAGSGTTAHAVLNANAKDRGNRKFILVELGDYAETVTAERVRRVIDGYIKTTAEESVLFDRKINLTSLKKGSQVFEEANAVAAEATQSGAYTKVSKPKLYTEVTGKNNASVSLRVTATVEHEEKAVGVPGSFAYYELGAPLFVQDGLNSEVPYEKMSEYIWYSETSTPLDPRGYNEAHKLHPHYLGKYDDTSYFFAYDPESATSLDRKYLGTIPTECAAESYVIYAETCLLDEKDLLSHNITFKKIARDISRV